MPRPFIATWFEIFIGHDLVNYFALFKTFPDFFTFFMRHRTDCDIVAHILESPVERTDSESAESVFGDFARLVTTSVRPPQFISDCNILVLVLRLAIEDDRFSIDEPFDLEQNSFFFGRATMLVKGIRVIEHDTFITLVKTPFFEFKQLVEITYNDVWDDD